MFLASKVDIILGSCTLWNFLKICIKYVQTRNQFSILRLFYVYTLSQKIHIIRISVQIIVQFFFTSFLTTVRHYYYAK